MHAQDRDGNEYKVGDVVLVPFKVRQIFGAGDETIAVLDTIEPAGRRSEYTSVWQAHGNQFVKAAPPAKPTTSILEESKTLPGDEA